MKEEHTVVLKNVQTEQGQIVKEFELKYTSYGKLNEKKDNVVWLIHPLTANSDPLLWWPGIVGKEHVFDPDRFFVICVNNPGSPYGSFSPHSINPDTRCKYLHDFPPLSMRDYANVFDSLRRLLGIEKIHIAGGASMGGQILYQWLSSVPHAIQTAIVVAASPRISAWMLASLQLQKESIQSDPTWKEDSPSAGRQGLKLARQIAFLSYRSSAVFRLFQDIRMKLSNEADEQGFTEPTDLHDTRKVVNEYLNHQGEKFVERFDVCSYLALLEVMCSHNIQGSHPSMEAALTGISANVLVIGTDSDLLFPPVEVRSVIPHIVLAQYKEISSVYGHDAFLVEHKQIEDIIYDYLVQIDTMYSPTDLPTDSDSDS